MDNVTFTPPAIANLKDMLNKSAMLYGEKDAYQIKNSDGTFTHYTYKDVLNMVQGLGTGLINTGLKGQKLLLSVKTVLNGKSLTLPLYVVLVLLFLLIRLYRKMNLKVLLSVQRLVQFFIQKNIRMH